MGGLLAALNLSPPKKSPQVGGGGASSAGDRELVQRLQALQARAASVRQGADAKKLAELDQRIAEAKAILDDVSSADKAARDKAGRVLDVVQMQVDDLAAVHAAAAKKYVPSPEAVKFTNHVKQTLARVVAIEKTHPDDGLRMKKAVVAAARLGAHPKERVKATTDLEAIDKELAKLQADAAAPKTAAAKEQLYTVKIGGKQLTNVGKVQVHAELKKVVDDLERRLQSGFESHCDALKIQREEPFAAWVSGGISAFTAKIHGKEKVDIFDLDIWDKPQKLLSDCKAALKRDDFDAVQGAIRPIQDATRECNAKIQRHTEDSIEAAGQAVEVARKVEEKSAEVIEKGTEKLTHSKAAGAAAKAGAKSVFQLFEQISGKYIAETQKEINWTEVGKEGVASLAESIVSELLEGAMAEHFSSLFGPYLSKAKFSEKELAELAKVLNLPQPLNRDFMMSRLQRKVKDFLLDKGKDFITGLVVDKIKGKKAADPDLSYEELMKSIAMKATTGKGLELFVDFVVHHAKP
jgi:hypothetical protein